jgi:hypothetical protein
MFYVENSIDEKQGWVIAIGDCHLGDKAFGTEAQAKLEGWIKWIRENKNARVILMGDIFNTATRVSKTSPFNQSRDDEKEKNKYGWLEDEYAWGVRLFKPIASQIVVALDGNHEHRLLDFANYSIMNQFCRELQIPYGGISAVIIFRINKFNQGTSHGSYNEMYKFYAHHTTGGGMTVGGKLNRVEALRRMVTNADVYLGAHNHMMGVVPVSCGVIDTNRKRVQYLRQYIVDCGSYLEWEGSYAEEKM